MGQQSQLPRRKPLKINHKSKQKKYFSLTPDKLKCFSKSNNSTYINLEPSWGGEGVDVQQKTKTFLQHLLLSHVFLSIFFQTEGFTKPQLYW